MLAEEGNGHAGHVHRSRGHAITGVGMGGERRHDPTVADASGVGLYSRTDTTSASEVVPAGGLGSGDGDSVDGLHGGLHRDQRDRDRYDIGDEAGRGGLGRVWRATDRELGRTVAVKELIRRDAVSEARFFREALITARLDHPGIVTIHETGRWDDGTPFYTMKHVDGRPLSALVADAATFAERLALLPQVTAVADTIAYAHEQGVLHRDLKPANVVVGRFGETIVIDFGLAKLRGPEVTTEVTTEVEPVDGDLTALGTILGTPSYMAPEQARGEALDERTDIYAVGAILYTVLAGRSPYPGSGSRRVLHDVLSAPPRPVQDRESQVPPALAAIVARAMARDPADRYASMAELAGDLKRFQTGQLVSAYTYSPVAILRRWAARHRTALAVAAVAAALLAAGGVYAVTRIVDERDVARHERTVARGERDRARAHADRLLLSDARQRLETDPTSALAVLADYPADGVGWTAVADLTNEALSRGAARRALATGDDTAALVAYSSDGAYLAAAGERSLRVWRTVDGAVVADPRFPGADKAAPTSLVAARAAPVFASAHFDGRVRVVDARTGATREWKASSPVYGVAISPDGAVVYGALADGTLRRWTVATGDEQSVAAHRGRVLEVTLAGDGTRLLSVGGDRVALWSLDLAPLPHPLSPPPAILMAAAMSPDGRVVAAGDERGGLWVWRGAGARRLDGGNRIERLVFSSDGSRVYGACLGDEIRIWDLRTGTSTVQPGGRSLALAPDGWIAAGAADGSVALLEPQSGWVRHLRGHRDPVQGVAWAPGGEIASIARGVVRVWPTEVRPRILDTGGRNVRNARLTGDGRWLIASNDTGTARAWELATGRTLALEAHRGDGFVRTAERGAWLVGRVDGAIVHWEPGDGAARRLGSVPGLIAAVDASGDGRVILVGTTAGGVVAATPDGTPTPVATLDGAISQISPSADRRYLAAGSRGGDILVYDPERREVVARAHHGAAITGLALLDGARWLAVDGDGTVRWVEGGAIATARTARAPYGRRIVASPGQVFAVLAGDGAVRVWDWAGTLRAEVRHSAGTSFNAAFTAEPHRLLTAGLDGAIHVVDLETGARRRLPAVWPRWDVSAPRPEGPLIAAGPNGHVQLWPLAALRWAPRAPLLLAAWLHQNRIAIEPVAESNPEEP